MIFRKLKLGTGERETLVLSRCIISWNPAIWLIWLLCIPCGISPISTDLHSIEDGMWGADNCLSSYFLLRSSLVQNIFLVRRRKNDAAIFDLVWPILTFKGQFVLQQEFNFEPRVCLLVQRDQGSVCGFLPSVAVIIGASLRAAKWEEAKSLERRDSWSLHGELDGDTASWRSSATQLKTLEKPRRKENPTQLGTPLPPLPPSTLCDFYFYFLNNFVSPF